MKPIKQPINFRNWNSGFCYTPWGTMITNQVVYRLKPKEDGWFFSLGYSDKEVLSEISYYNKEAYSEFIRTIQPVREIL